MTEARSCALVIALFCDSDETGDDTVAHFADVRVERRGAEYLPRTRH